MNGEARFTTAVAGVVLHADGRVLLIRTERAGWELPGGRVEHGEDLIEALKREVQEECGCMISVERLAGLSTNTESSGFIALTFRCRHESGEPSAGDDSLDASWFSPADADRMITHPAERTRLRDALASAGGVSYRVYGEKAHYDV
jgi:8-oxo-dGTP diphosphatase